MSKERVSYLRTQEQNIETTSPPRVILLDPGGNFPLVPYKNTPWLGLPGGKVEKSEYKPESNLLSTGSFPTLKREVMEECGIDISPNLLLKRSACLGLVEVSWISVNEPKRRMIHHYTHVFVCMVPESTLTNLGEGVVIANIHSHLPGPLFPDARIAIEYLKQSLGEKRKGPILPEFLGPEKFLWFQMSPTMGLLFGRPTQF